MNRAKTVSIALFSFLLVVSACSDDKQKEGYVTLGGKSEITVERLSDYYPLPLETKGAWKCTTDAEWLAVEPSSGIGGESVSLFVEANETSGERVATLTFTSLSNPENSCRLSLRQNELLDGEAVNSSELFPDAFSGLCIGKGINIMTGQVTQAILNWKKIKTLDDWGYFDEDIYYAHEVSKSEYKTPVHIIEDSSTHHNIDVKASVDVSVLFFKVKVHGEYSGGQDDKTKIRKFYATCFFPRYEAELGSVETMIDVYDKGMASGDNDCIKDVQHIFTSDFADYRRQAINAYTHPEVGIDKFYKALKGIDYLFGPAYIVSSTMGGLVGVDINADYSRTSNWTHISGELAANLDLFFVKLDADAYVTVNKQHSTVFSNATYRFQSMGGDAKLSNAMYRAYMDNDRPDNTAINKWTQSVHYSNKNGENNAALIKFVPEGIWTLFPDDIDGLQEKVEDYFRSVYKDKEGVLLDIFK